MVAVEEGRIAKGLADVAPLAIAAVDDVGRAVALVDQFDIVAFAREQRLAHIGGPQGGFGGIALEIGFQQIGVAFVAFPQQGQDGLVGQDALPGRLKDADVGRGQGRGVFIAQHLFPGVELEQGLDDPVLVIDKPALFVQADLVDGDELGVQTGLTGQVLEEAHRLAVLDEVGVRGEMDEAAVGEDGAEPVDQLLVQAVELVGVGGQDAGGDLVLQPQPLEHRRLIDAGRGVGVVFVELGRASAVIGEVEPAIEGRVAPLPAVGHIVPHGFWNIELLHQPLGLNGVVDQIQAQAVQFGGRRLDPVLDLGQREGVGRRLVPIGFAVGVAPGEAEFLGLGVPVGSGFEAQTLHGSGRVLVGRGLADARRDHGHVGLAEAGQDVVGRGMAGQDAGVAQLGVQVGAGAAVFQGLAGV